MSVKFDARMADWREQIDDRLKSIIERTSYPSDFCEALEYAVFPGGKRIRPILFLEWHSLYSPPDDNALDFACGLELMHCFSLVHDDMPCIDNDDFRRGKPSVHKQYGEGKALLVGDALLELSMNCMISACCNAGNCDPFFFYRLCGGNGIIHGEYLDVYGKCRSIEDLIYVYKRKTGAIIESACTVGYLFAQKTTVSDLTGLVVKDDVTGRLDESTFKTNEQAVKVGGAARFGELFGTAFQLYDDISEYVSGEKSDGTTVMDYLDLDEAKKMLNHYLNDAAESLDFDYGGDVSFLRELVEKFVIV